MNLTAAEVKQQARRLGADLVGIAAADTLNAYPPDPQYPQVPNRLSADIRSVIVCAVRMPLGEFRAQNQTCIRHVNQLVLRRMERVAFDLVGYLEQQGYYGFQVAAEETAWEMKKASYGYLSTRHLGVEAGLGTLGLEVNILTPEFGPRVYLTGVLTNAELEPDQRITRQLCIGETCGRCLLACPPDAVLHWGLDKRKCATYAQSLGIARAYRFFRDAVTLGDTDQRVEHLTSGTAYEIWQSVLRVVGAFGNCPRCIEVCPIGDDYVKYLARQHKEIPEKTPEKLIRLRELKTGRDRGAGGPGLNNWNIRWVGEAGYSPPQKGGRMSQEQVDEQVLAERSSVLTGALKPVTAELVKAKARALGADLVGVASGAGLEQHPPDPRLPQTPRLISQEDGRTVIVLARRLLWGAARIPGPSQQKLYSMELILSRLQEAALELVYWLEDQGYPSLTIPSNHTDWEPGEGLYGPLSLSHVAVEAGLGTLGLNLQLLTPEYGPRVLLAAVLTSAPLAPDKPLGTPLCRGPECGRCLLACPPDAIGQWTLDKAACSPYAAPMGFHRVKEHVTNILQTESQADQLKLAAGKETFELWQSMLHAVGVYTGCTRCLEVCPVGQDYAQHLQATQEAIPESTPEKLIKLTEIRSREASGDRGPAYPHSARWIDGPGYERQGDRI